MKKGHRSEVHMSDVKIWHGFEDWRSIRCWTSIWVLYVYILLCIAIALYLPIQIKVIIFIPLSAFSASSSSFLLASSALLTASYSACSVHCFIISVAPSLSRLFPFKYTSLRNTHHYLWLFHVIKKNNDKSYLINLE